MIPNRWYDHLNVCLRLQFIYTCLNTPQYTHPYYTFLLSVLCIPYFDYNNTRCLFHTSAQAASYTTHAVPRPCHCILYAATTSGGSNEGISCKADRGKDFCKVHSTCGALVKAKCLFMCIYGLFVYIKFSAGFAAQLWLILSDQ